MTRSKGLDRRAVLGLVGAGLAAGALPPVAAAAFASDADDASPEDGPLEEGLRRARAAGKPLLVLLVPADEARRHERGRVWGQLFGTSTDGELAELALCELACASGDSLAAAFPQLAKDLADEPLAVLIETDAPELGARVVGAELPAVPGHAFPEKSGAFAEQVHARAQALRRVLTRAIAGDAATVERRALQARTVPGVRGGFGAPWEEVLMTLDSARPRLTDLDRYAAVVLQHAAKRGRDEERELRRLLGAAAARRLWEEDPPGAAWVRDSGYCPPCGMAYVPKESRDFLRFYTEDEAR